MASSIKIARAQTALLLCLPVTILIGYLAGRSDAVEQHGGGCFGLWRNECATVYEVVLDKPWRMTLTALFLALGLLTGFRSAFGFVALIFIVAFFLEGLHRTRYLPVIAMLAVICGSFLFVFSKNLPPQMQRALSFLPVNVSPSVKEDAQGSLDWRMFRTICSRATVML